MTTDTYTSADEDRIAFQPWKEIAERFPSVLAASSHDETIRRGLELIQKIVGADFAIFHHESHPQCKQIFATFESHAASLILNETQTCALRTMPDEARSSILLPMHGNESFLGILHLATTSNEFSWHRYTETLQSYAHMFAVALEKARTCDKLSTVVTSYQEVQNSLTSAAIAASEANQAKTNFLANISHELRTPLGVILGFADLTLDLSSLDEDARTYVTTIKRNGQQLAQILGEVLDLSKIEASRLEIEEMRFPVVPLLNEVVSSFQLSAREKGLSLSFDEVGPLPKVVKTDPTRLRQVLTNLIGNAIKFTEKGKVTLSAKMNSAGDSASPLTLEIAVSDTGIGIAPEGVGRLFQPYRQGEPSISRRFGGTGLGLTLSRQLVEALGGELRLQQSTPGQGSTFVFTISAGGFDGDLMPECNYSLGMSVAHAPERVDENSFAGKRILVIEDSSDNQVLISRYLSAVGLAVDLASNGREGLEKSMINSYDLVVLDIQMPDMDGHQVAAKLRERGFSNPIIALTAHAFKEDRDRAFASGFNEYLTKPINRSTLIKTLQSRLSSQAPSLH